MKKILITMVLVVLFTTGCKNIKNENKSDENFQNINSENTSNIEQKNNYKNQSESNNEKVENSSSGKVEVEKNKIPDIDLTNKLPVISKIEQLDKNLISKISLSAAYDKIDISNLSNKIDWSSKMPPVRLQSVSCNAWASIYNAKTYYEGLEEGWDITQDSHIFSPSWTYNQISAENGDFNPYYHLQLVVKSGCDTLNNFPICDESILPDEESYKRALKYRAKEVKLLDRKVNDMKVALKEKHIIVIGMKVYPDLDKITPANDTYDTILDNETSRGYHWICIVGYDDNKNAFKCINSWGDTYGTWKNENNHNQGKGYFYLSYELVENPENPASISAGGYILYDMKNTNSLLTPKAELPKVELKELIKRDFSTINQ